MSSPHPQRAGSGVCATSDLAVTDGLSRLRPVVRPFVTYLFEKMKGVVTKVTFANRFCLSIYFIRLRSHDEIVLMQAADLMRPPLDCYSPPFSNNQRVVIFFFGNGANLVGKL